MMTLSATFDGHAFYPDELPTLPVNTRVQLSIETLLTATTAPQSFLDLAASLNLEGDRDWSVRYKEELYPPTSTPIDQL
ncbi:MAG: hypothetical protein BWK78_09185 [Thiotrichaceae bacterium IS1]|nr:MAG: hypothetical protein BWK78_09185 [Thiotrichaceae bacterium IS1]